MGKRNKNKNKKRITKQSLIKPSKCAKCEEYSYVFICGLCPDCFNETEV